MPRPVPARNAAAVPRSPLDAGAPPGGADLPIWDLGDLYRSPEDPALEADLGAADAEARDFAARLAGKLGGMDGAALAKRVAAARPGVPIVMLTGYADLDALADAPVAAVVQKPVDADALRDRIAGVLAG